MEDDALDKLHGRLTAELGEYSVEAFLNMVHRRVRKAPRGEPVTPGLVFSQKNGLVADFCAWMRRLKTTSEQARRHAAAPPPPPSTADRIAQLQEMLHEMPEHPQAHEWTRELVELTAPRNGAKGVHA
jgi:hypothetical protein